jgi:hypothetical protein
VVQTVLGEEWLLGVLGGGLVTLRGLGLGLLEETSLLLLLGLWLVLVEELEELGGGVLVKGVTELGDCGGDLEWKATLAKVGEQRPQTRVVETHLQPLVEDDLLPLQPNILGPLDESSEILLRKSITT